MQAPIIRDFTIYQYVPQQVVITAESAEQALQIANAKAREQGAILVSSSPNPEQHLQQALGVKQLLNEMETVKAFLVVVLILQLAFGVFLM